MLSAFDSTDPPPLVGGDAEEVTMDSEKRLKMVLDAIVTAHTVEVEAEAKREQVEAQHAFARASLESESKSESPKPS